ncbi:thioredoxin-like protein [Spinellus fusiger]|nr:thioredoxin-like protein [Spinellus fusiger]
MKTLYDFTVKNIKNAEWNLEELKGKVVLIVNVASKCGFTKQYGGLEQLYKDLQAKEGANFEIIGVPCNQFGSQEPGTEDEIQSFCKLTWDVTFPLTAKMDVNGDDEAPLYTWLKESQSGLLGLKRIKWNFEKFLINKEGKVVNRYSSLTEPKAILDDIQKLL